MFEYLFVIIIFGGVVRFRYDIYNTCKVKYTKFRKLNQLVSLKHKNNTCKNIIESINIIRGIWWLDVKEFFNKSRDLL